MKIGVMAPLGGPLAPPWMHPVTFAAALIVDMPTPGGPTRPWS